MREDATGDGWDLRGVLLVLRRRGALFIACVLLVPAAATGLSLLQEEKYSTSASLLPRESELDQRLLGPRQPSSDPAREAATNVKLVSLETVAERAARALRGRLTPDQVSDRVDVSGEEPSDVVKVTATDRSPGFAAKLANTFANEYVDFRRQADRKKVRQALGSVQRQLKALPKGRRNDPRARALSRRLQDLELLLAIQTGNAEVVQSAKVPTKPSSPKPVRNAVLGGVLGILLGLVLAFVADRFDRRLRDPKEVENLGLPILGQVPQSGGLAGLWPDTESLPAQDIEAFHMLRTNLRYFNVDRKVRSLLVTSAGPSEGKSTIAWYLAATAAGAGSRVLLIEADLRAPVLASWLDLSTEGGLSGTLAGQVETRDAVYRVPVVDATNASAPSRTLDVIVAGRTPPNPGELIESARMSRLLRDAHDRYELVVIDTSPVSLVSDAVPLVKQVSGVLVVTRLGSTTVDAVVGLQHQLEQLRAPVLGVVLNSSSARPAYYGYYSPTRREEGSSLEA